MFLEKVLDDISVVKKGADTSVVVKPKDALRVFDAFPITDFVAFPEMNGELVMGIPF